MDRIKVRRGPPPQKYKSLGRIFLKKILNH